MPHGGGRALNSGAPAPGVVNETKVGIVAVMRELDIATTSSELHAIWDKSKPLAVFDYHLSTLVRAGIAEIVSGPELRFRLLQARQKGQASAYKKDCCISLMPERRRAARASS